MKEEEEKKQKALANARIKVTRTIGKKGKRKISASVVEDGE